MKDWEADPKLLQDLKAAPHWPKPKEVITCLARDVPIILAKYEAAIDRILLLEFAIARIEERTIDNLIAIKRTKGGINEIESNTNNEAIEKCETAAKKK